MLPFNKTKFFKTFLCSLLIVAAIRGENCQLIKPLQGDEKYDLDSANRAALEILSAYSQPITNESKLYSSMWCSDEGATSPPHYRACTFRNICYRRSSGQWVLFLPNVTNGRNAYPLLHSGEGKALFELPQKLITTMIAHPWPPELYFTGPAPSFQLLSGFVPLGEKTHWVEEGKMAVLHHSHVPQNLGHFLGEDLTPIVQLSEMFNGEDEGQGCDQDTFVMLSSDAFRSNENAKKFFNGLLKPLVGKLASFRDTVEQVPAGTEQVCFPKLSMGSGRFEIDSKRALSLRSMDYLRVKQRLFDHYKLPQGLPEKCGITLFIKPSGRRAPIYETNISQKLQKEFPQCQITVLDPATLSVLGQLELMSRTTILISPCGGISFTALFLPQYASFISICGLNIPDARGYSVEHYFWKWFPWITTSHYPIEEKELSVPSGVDGNWASWSSGYYSFLNCQDGGDQLREFYFHGMIVHVNTKKLVSLIHANLIRTQILSGTW